MTITEKVAYLKGLSEGLGIDKEKSKEGKLIAVIIDVLEEIGLSIEDLEENAEAIAEELDAISDDLSDVEELLFEDDDEDYEDDDEDFFQISCPSCGEDLEIDMETIEEGEVRCPACKQRFALDVSDDCDCDCCCGHDHEAEDAE